MENKGKLILNNKFSITGIIPVRTIVKFSILNWLWLYFKEEISIIIMAFYKFGIL